MTLFEYSKKVQPGRRVYISVQGSKVYGTACNLYSTAGVDYTIKFDSGLLVKVTEGTAHLVHMEEAN